MRGHEENVRKKVFSNYKRGPRVERAQRARHGPLESLSNCFSRPRRTVGNPFHKRRTNLEGKENLEDTWRDYQFAKRREDLGSLVELQQRSSKVYFS